MNSRIIMTGLAIFLLAVLFHASLRSHEKKEEHFEIMGQNETLQYTNDDETIEPWTRHHISSVPGETKGKYKTTYNYELENSAFTSGLKKAFGENCNDMISVADLRNWSKDKNPMDAGASMKESYNDLVKWLTAKVQDSNELKLEGLDEQPKIQIVHDRWISFREQKNAESNSILFHLEVLFYREAKYHGKHYEFWIRSSDSGFGLDFVVIAVTFKGMVFEDQIALFPVLGVDSINLQQQYAPPLK